MVPKLYRKPIGFFCILTLCTFLTTIHAQRGAKIGFIDTEYILENVPEYQEAMTQLDSKVQDWRTEIEQRLSAIESRQDLLNNERVLLTQSLIEERQSDIDADRNELIDYQQKRFGPRGDYLMQKQQLMQPIQDQIFNAVQDLVSSRKYDFVFDKSADVVMLYANDQYDLSEVVLRSITRTSERKQVEDRKNKKELENEEVVEAEDLDSFGEVTETKTNDLEDRKKAIEKARAERAKAAEEKRKQIEQQREDRKKAYEERRIKLMEKREADKKAREEARNKKKKDN